MAGTAGSLGSSDHRVRYPTASVPPPPPPPTPTVRAAPPPGGRRRCPHVGDGAGEAEEGLGVLGGVCPRVGEANWQSPRGALFRQVLGPGLGEGGAGTRESLASIKISTGPRAWAAVSHSACGPAPLSLLVNLSPPRPRAVVGAARRHPLFTNQAEPVAFRLPRL